MRIEQKIGISVIVPALIYTVVHTACNRPCNNKNIPETTVNNSTKNADIFEQYEMAKDAYSRGTISADSFQTIQKRFEEEMKYVECGD